jgi:hypothetical protein
LIVCSATSLLIGRSVFSERRGIGGDDKKHVFPIRSIQIFGWRHSVVPIDSVLKIRNASNARRTKALPVECIVYRAVDGHQIFVESTEALNKLS